MKDTLTADEAAKLAGITGNNLRTQIRQGSLTAYKIKTGKRGQPPYRIKRADLDVWLSARKELVPYEPKKK